MSLITRRTTKLLTLVLVHGQQLCKPYGVHQVLLGMKKRGFGMGKWNGFGGKVEYGESVECGAMRELREECGVIGVDPVKRGVLVFEFESKSELLEVHVFAVTKFQGDIVESEEMRPSFFTLDRIPFHSMWKDDILWYPHIFENRYFVGYFLFRGHDTLLEHNIKCVEECEFSREEQLRQHIQTILPPPRP